MTKKTPSSTLDWIKYPLITEKTVSLIAKNQYTFLVDPKISKDKIKEAIEFIFDVKVVKVNTCLLVPKWGQRFQKPGGSKKFFPPGRKRFYKKAMVKLIEGDSIDLYSFP